MRKLTLLVVVLLGLSLALPYWGGREAETAFKEKAAALSTSDERQIEVQVLRYERGWFRSTARTRLTVRGTTPPESLVVNHEIVHGPLPLGEVVHGALPRGLVGAVVYSHDAPSAEDASSEHAPFVRLRTEVGLRKDLAIEFDILPSQDPEQGFEWDGLHGAASVPRTGKRTLTFESPGLRVAQRGFSLDIGTLRGGLEMEFSASGIPLGQGTVEAASLRVEQTRKGGRASRQLELRDVRWTQTVTERVPGTIVDLSTDVRFGAARGWASRIQGGEWHLRCQTLDSQALRALASTIRTAGAGRRAGLGPPSRQALAQLVSREPRFEMWLKVTTSDGVIEGTGDMTTTATATLAALRAGAPPSRLPSDWFLTLFFTPAVFDPAKLDPLWQANLLTVDGDRYRLTARYRQGVVDLNGTIVPLEDLGSRVRLLLRVLRL